MIRRIKYSDARSAMRVGDWIGYRGRMPISRAILLIKPGMFGWNHISSVESDVITDPDQRVRVTEAVSRGIAINPLSDTLRKYRGRLYWVPMHNNPEQQAYIRELTAWALGQNIRYDWWATVKAALRPILIDIRRFNCSEWAWYKQVMCERVEPLYDRRGRQIAPVPGDCPMYARAPDVYELF